ncbi:MAG: ATP-dependent helicase, partial [Planctomycetota bacterium]|nr:ATP-dependent helicase [Planctomycetota bacterium]
MDGSENLEIGVTPSGQVLVAPSPFAGDSAWEAPIGSRRDEPGGAEALLLSLAAEEGERRLPPAWGYWRDFARSYIIALCHLPEEEAALAPPPPNPRRLEELAAAVPPMPGGEYVTAEVMAALWGRLDAR